MLTKCWNREVTLATNFGSHAQMVTKFGGQNLATKFGFVPDCWKCHQINHFWSNFAWNWSNSAWILSFASEKWWNQVKMAKISQKYILGYRASAKIRPLATEISPKRDPWLRKLWNWAPKGNLAGSTPPVRSTHNKCLSHKYMYMYLTWFNLKNFWHSHELGSLLYSLYKIPLAQACFPLARPNFHSHWWALLS